MKNLSDLDPKTTTVLRPDKEGKYHLTLHMRDSMTVTGIILIPGYGKDSAGWFNNSRVKKIETPFDRSFWFDNSQDHSQPKSFDWQGLADASFKISVGYVDYYYNEDTHWYPSAGEQVSEVRIDIKDIIKGNKYDNLCISEIIVLGAPGR